MQQMLYKHGWLPIGLCGYAKLLSFLLSVAACVLKVEDLAEYLVEQAMFQACFSHASQEGQSEEEVRACPACAKRGQQGWLGVKVAKGSGGFIGCSSYPDCSYSQPLEDITKSIKSDQESDDELFLGMSEGVCGHRV